VSPLVYRCSAGGAFLWPWQVIVVSAHSSTLPAANTALLTVREALSFESNLFYNWVFDEDFI